MKYSDWFGELWVRHLGIDVREVHVGFVMDEKVGFGDPVLSDDNHLGLAVVETDALVPISAKDQRLPVLDLDGVLGHRVLLGRVEPRLVVEDVAVLVDLDKRSPLVRDATLVDLVHAFHVHVDTACDEGASGSDRDGDWVDREVDRSRWGGR